MIKCPECGRQISDRAPFCPSCGAAIADKIIKCPQCGEIYFKDLDLCPNCHHVSAQIGNNSQPTPPTPPAGNAISTPPTPPVGHSVRPAQPTPPTPPSTPQKPAEDKPKKKSYTSLIIAFIFAVVVCGVCFYFYNNAKSSKELEAYEFAMSSKDALVLQTYLDSYKDAPQDHIDAITAQLDKLKQNDTEWSNAVVSGNRQALSDYLAKHPDSEHKAEALRKIDSLDWVQASNENTIEALNKYTQEHPEGNYINEAGDAIKVLKAKTVQPEEKTLVSSVLRHFFQAINSRNEEALQASVAPLLTSFLNKPDATKADVVTFMHKIYKDDITNMNWHVDKEMKIDKKEVGDEQYEYTVNVSVSQDMERTDPDKEKHANYKLVAKISPDGLITSMTLTKIYE